MRRRIAHAVVCAVAASALLTACAHKHATGSAGLDSVGASAGVSGPAVAPPPTSTPGSKTTPTKKSGGGGGGNQPPSGAPSSASPPSTPPVKPTKAGIYTFKLPSDYGVTVDNFCYWATNQDGSQSLYAGYTFHYRGFLSPKQLNFVGQDNFGHNTYSYIGGSWFNNGFYENDEGVNVSGFSFSGQRVVLNVYLLPAVNNLLDDNAANNRAEVTIYVPNTSPPAYEDHGVRVNCVVDYGTSF